MSCPSCKSENIKYFKKRQTAPGENADEILCVCQDCAHKWKRRQKVSSSPKPVSRPRVQTQSVSQNVRRQPSAAVTPKKPQWTKQERALQIILAVLLWPVTITYWFYENRAIGLEKRSRIAVICVGWLLVIAGVFGLAYIAAHPKPRVELDYSVSTTVNVSTAQFATTTTGKNSANNTAASASSAAQTTVNSIFS